MTTKSKYPATMFLTKEQLNKTKQQYCSICGSGLSISKPHSTSESTNDYGVHADSFDAEPIAEGRCCGICKSKFVNEAIHLGLAAVKDQVSEVKFRKIIKQELGLKSLFKNWKPKRQIKRKIRALKEIEKDCWGYMGGWCHHYGWFPSSWPENWNPIEDNPPEKNINHFNPLYFYIVRDYMLRMTKAGNERKQLEKELKQLEQGEK